MPLTAVADALTNDPDPTDDSIDVDTTALLILGGDINRDFTLDAADLATYLRALTDPSYTPPGDPDCAVDLVTDPNDLLCLLALLFP